MDDVGVLKVELLEVDGCTTASARDDWPAGLLFRCSSSRSESGMGPPSRKTYPGIGMLNQILRQLTPQRRQEKGLFVDNLSECSLLKADVTRCRQSQGSHVQTLYSPPAMQAICVDAPLGRL